jgi:ABC-2 type transport system permease protein
VYQRRDPTSMIYWGLILVIMVVVSVNSLRGQGQAPVVGVLLSAGFGGAFTGVLHDNAIALTGPPFYLDALALTGRKAMRAWFVGQDLVFAAFAVPLILVIPMAIAFIAGHPAYGFLAWALGLAALGAGLGISNVFSATLPWPAVKRPGNPTPRAADGYTGHSVASRLGTLFGTVLLVLPVIFAIAATGSVADGARMPALIAGGAVYGTLLAWAGATIAGSIARGKLPELFQLAARTMLLQSGAFTVRGFDRPGFYRPGQCNTRAASWRSQCGQPHC